jgi:DNA-binding Lrp family transcriptional regulator
MAVSGDRDGSGNLRAARKNVLLRSSQNRPLEEQEWRFGPFGSMIVLDRTDHAILEALQRDSRQTVQQLAAAVGLTSTPCWKRVKAMEAAGVIRGYGAVVDRAQVGLSLCVLAEVNLTQHSEATVRDFERAVAACPQIVACYSTTGAADYSIKVLVPDIRAYESFLHETAFRLPGVTHVRSSVVLKEVKAEAGVPIPGAAAPPASRSPPAGRGRAPRRAG